MKLPKTVQIGGRTWRVERNLSIDGGEFFTHPGLIRIGRVANDEQVIQVLIHEILEAILVEGHHRYEHPAEDHLFVFRHIDLCRIHKELYAALKPILREC